MIRNKELKYTMLKKECNSSNFKFKTTKEVGEMKDVIGQEKAIEALQEMSAATSKVLRDGRIQTIHSEDLVVGDVVLLEAGDAVPADGRLIENASLKVEEAALKVEEELKEVLDVYKSNNKEKIKDEVGDLIFACVNVSRLLKIDEEEALNSTIKKFINRFSFIEEEALKNDKILSEMTLEEMDELWNKAKSKEFNEI